nr:tyrosine-type recombinase/integrase [Aestuariicella albida]
MARQTVNRHIHALVERVGGAPFRISAHTFRHSFAIHLSLHGRPLKYVSQLLRHRSVDSTEIYSYMSFPPSAFGTISSGIYLSIFTLFIPSNG